MRRTTDCVCVAADAFHLPRLPQLVWCVVLVHWVWPMASAGEVWRPAADSAHVQRAGEWSPARHRYASMAALATEADNAALELTFTGCAVVLSLDTLTPPNQYGPPELGRLDVFVDGGFVRSIWPRVEAREVIVHRTTGVETHRVRVVHRATDTGAGCRINGFRVVDTPTGELGFVATGERSGALIDVRVIVSREGRVVRDVLTRNWLSGRCRIAGLPPGENYTLEVRAAGWRTWRKDGVRVQAGEETELPPVHLLRTWDIPVDSFKFPVFGQAIVRRPAESFRARFQAWQEEIQAVRVVRHVGPAVITRECRFEDDGAAAYYYHREGSVTLPADVPPGLYDLEVTVGGATPRSLVSRRAVHVVGAFPSDPVFIAFGHLDTWGQEQAEYLARIVDIANIIAPDMVLISNEANPAYVAGVLQGLEMPFVVNFGNHRAPEPGAWFANEIGAVDFGREFSVVNFGRAWDTSTAEAHELWSARRDVRIRIVNAFEPNAPVRDFLDRHAIALIHDAHGPGPTVARVGATPTLRVGKANSESFRVIRFRDGAPVSATYRGHATAPIPFRRDQRAPVRLEYETHASADRAAAARWENELEEPFAGARAEFVLAAGKYAVDGGRLERAVVCDDGKHMVLAVRFDMPASSRGVATVRRE